VLSWRTAEIPEFDLTEPLTAATPDPILFVSACGEAERLQPFYQRVEALGPVRTLVGENGMRGYYAFKLSGPRGPIQALAACIKPW
jgi:hypothetical protein